MERKMRKENLILKKLLRLIRLEHHFTKFEMAVLLLHPRREYQLEI